MKQPGCHRNQHLQLHDHCDSSCQMEYLSAEIDFAAAKLARACADEWTAPHGPRAGSPRYVAGVLGPTEAAPICSGQ
ncbi:hypothetical protein ACLB1N_22600 [Escherichia coli]